MAKKAAKKAAKKSVKTSAKKPVKKSVKKPARKRGVTGPSQSSISFGPTKTELASLRGKLQAVIVKDGPNLTLQDIIDKIDKLDSALICQTIMTPTFP